MSYQGNYPPSTPLTSSQIAAGAVQPSNLSATGPSWDGSGNVGIGTSSPTQRVTIGGASDQIINRNVTDGGLIICGGPSATSGTLVMRGISSAYNTAGLEFYAGGAERARIDSSGNLLVGTTSVINGSNAILQALNVNGGRPGINVGNSVGSSATNCVIFTNSNGTVGSIQTSGTATSYVTSSDYRLKNSVEPMTTGLATVSALKPVTYKWNVDNSDGEGFIAHELQSVIPHSVTGEKDAVNEDGSIKPQGVDYSKIVVHLVAALQEAVAKIDTLEARIATLEAK